MTSSDGSWHVVDECSDDSDSGVARRNTKTQCVGWTADQQQDRVRSRSKDSASPAHKQFKASSAELDPASFEDDLSDMPFKDQLTGKRFGGNLPWLPLS